MLDSQPGLLLGEGNLPAARGKDGMGDREAGPGAGDDQTVLQLWPHPGLWMRTLSHLTSMQTYSRVASVHRLYVKVIA